MDQRKFPEYTIILRNYTQVQANAVLEAIVGLEADFAVEVTMNSQNATKIIMQLNQKYGSQVKIGAGTVLNLSKEKSAIAAGAKFILSACAMSKEMINYAQKNKVLAIPGVMTPTGVFQMINYGADIVKIFPATVIGPSFFKEIQGPLGDLDLMAVGGVSEYNIKKFKDNRVKYFGIGSNAFNQLDIDNLNVKGLQNSLLKLVK
ncbi:bifunctional 4-hydroxy-2-oxoglutarate aldolase/2-dehydro-3-deoxy-phosphogluconate aldolase [uncultured Lactobacillus sp.]|uniref:bifunctional 4-hydroxy-2-oxoglutarate aldolase/2-dehydro-3-deoxy-phosphogluconate aldolase n=1 Tax=uncultured Lactobacillus sp. TaxID=153152 RepID=UPI0025D1D7F7|nr:bifunctional 4-hydroxy-2-oxoglutarate aldolase/2-dehydro-3-deoxy-phosphogluconate aldolase [uncultured Lactobacillus sp.]